MVEGFLVKAVGKEDEEAQLLLQSALSSVLVRG